MDKVNQFKDELLRLIALETNGDSYLTIAIYLLYQRYWPDSNAHELATAFARPTMNMVKSLALTLDDPLRPAATVEKDYAALFKDSGRDSEIGKRQYFLTELTAKIYRLRLIESGISKNHISTTPIRNFLRRYLPNPERHVFDDGDLALGESGHLERKWVELAELLDEVLQLRAITLPA